MVMGSLRMINSFQLKMARHPATLGEPTNRVPRCESANTDNATRSRKETQVQVVSAVST